MFAAGECKGGQSDAERWAALGGGNGEIGGKLWEACR